MNTVVVYTSKYGSTEKYAHWIAEALGCNAKNFLNYRQKIYQTLIRLFTAAAYMLEALPDSRSFCRNLGVRTIKRLLCTWLDYKSRNER